MENCELEQRRSDAAGQDKCYSKARLRDEFRMKPRPGAVPVKHYKNEFGKQFGIYRISDCIPIQERQAAPSKTMASRTAMIVIAGFCSWCLVTHHASRAAVPRW